MNNNGYSVVVIAIAFGYLASIYILAPSSAAGQLPAVLAFLGVTITLLQKSSANEKKIDAVTAKVDGHAAELEKNTEITEQAARNGEEALKLVNGQSTAAATREAVLRAQLEEIMATLNRERGQHDAGGIAASAPNRARTPAAPSPADAAALGAAKAVEDAPPSAEPGVTADAAARGAAKATKP